MRMTNRTGSVLVALVIAGGAVTTLSAQNYGMPLFTSPRYATGIRVHADVGFPSDAINNADVMIVQGGLSFVIGPVGIFAGASGNKTDLQNCQQSQTVDCSSLAVSAGGVAQLRVYGGGRRNVSVSLFGGAGTDVTAADYVTGGKMPKQLNIPLGMAVGYRIPLGVASLNVWGAPRYNIFKWVNCQSGDPLCGLGSKGDFRWAVGADLPIFRIISIRAAYDGGKLFGETMNYFGAGLSIGAGGMR